MKNSLKTKSVIIAKNLIFHECDSTIDIGKDVYLYDTTIEIGKGSSLLIEDNCHFRGGKISIGSYCNVRIKKGLSVTSRCVIRCTEATNVLIGEDCLIASNVTLRTTDGHRIYNSDDERINRSQDIIIGDHVWLGDDVLILKGVRIGDGCVVGARSVVTKSFDPNNLIVGTPAKSVKTQIRWEH